MSEKLRAGLVILLLIAVWGTAPAFGQSDPCGLLTREEAETLMGEQVEDPEQKDTKNPMGQKICFYDMHSSSRFLQISVVRTADMTAQIRKYGQSAAKVYHSTKEMLSPQENVPGIGDDAFWSIPGLHILKGECYVLVSVGNTSRPENLDLARRIAERVLSRL